MIFTKPNPVGLVFICFYFCAQFDLHNSQAVFDRIFAKNSFSKAKCMTYKSTPGFCIPLDQCEELKNNKNLNLIRIELCGFSDYMPKVCCSTSNDAPNPYYYYRPQPKRRERDYSSESDNLSLDYPAKLPQNCGITENFERCSGFVAVPGEAPWMASIQYGKKGNKEHLCGGALISTNLIATAYHCIKNDDSLSIDIKMLRVRLGEHDIVKDSPDNAVQEYEVSEVIVHPNYEKYSKNDIVLLRLKAPVTFNEKVSPICLPYDSELVRKQNLSGKTVKVTGWPSINENYLNSQVLLRDNLMVLDQEFCKNSFENTLEIKEEHICAVPERSKESCQNDNGAPLAIFDPSKKRWYLAGVTSFDKRCISREAPGIYTRISKQLAWINEHI